MADTPAQGAMRHSKVPVGEMNVSGPLAGLNVIEQFGPNSTDPSRAAVSFAGLLAAQFGAKVTRVEPEGGDPMRDWAPRDGAGSVIFDFLTQSKTVGVRAPVSGTAFLLTDDADLVQSWSTARSICVRPLPSGASEPASEITLMARAGLLDIFGTPGSRPKPLPGHQLAYSAGIAAFNALLSAHLSALRNQHVEPVLVTMLDVALWVNWKHFLAGWQGEPAGLDRKEEWTSLRCADGYIALTFQDKDMGGLAEMTGNDYFRSPSLATRTLRKSHIPEINAALQAWSSRHSRGHIAERAKALRLPVGPVLSLAEVVDDAHLAHREFFRLCQNGRRFPRLPLLWNGEAIDRVTPAQDGQRIALGDRQ